MPRVTLEEAEKSIMTRFIDAYIKEFGVRLEKVIKRERPDFEAFDPKLKKNLGIEITGAYQDEEEAKIQYWAVNGWDIFEGSPDKIITSLNKIIKKKAIKSKNYRYCGMLVLAIWIVSLIFHEKFYIDFIRHDILIPITHFDMIWLIIRSKSDDSPELYCLRRRG